ncbi:hypothetical protein K9M09_01960 [Patescibacteria group bacterium]|nr:hypothetical protein [Patescibacteria group bacterium]
MGAVDSLPSGGKKFSHLGFKKKLKVYAKTNSLIGSLSDHQEAINKAVFRYRHLISKGAFKPTYQRTALSKIKAENPLSAHQTMVVKKVLKRLGEDSSVSHARINREEDVVERTHSGLAQGVVPSNSKGLSGVSSPEVQKSSRPMVSISQATNTTKSSPTRSTGLAGGLSGGTSNSAPSSRPPMIPLVR